MKKILLIHTGGTFGMKPVEPDDTLAPGNFQSEILSFVPEIAQLADIEIKIPFNLDSSNIGKEEWQILAELIFNNLDAFDGFVIIHGTDTMAYTASALSFSLLNLNKPVVLTGAQRPLSQLRNDARTNLIDAIELATMDIPEVVIVFGQRVLRGNRSKKVNIFSYDAFDSPNFPYLGRIGVHIDLDKGRVLTVHGTPVLLPGFSEKVAVITIQPSQSTDLYLPLFDSGIRAFILVGFGAGNVPDREAHWVEFIRQAYEKGKPVLIASHSTYGRINLELYESGRKALQAGAKGIGAMTCEAAYVKLQKILTVTKDRDVIYRKFFQNWAGEL